MSENEIRLVNATTAIHTAVGGLTILEAIALLEIAAARYKTYITVKTIQGEEVEPEIYTSPTPDDKRDCA